MTRVLAVLAAVAMVVAALWVRDRLHDADDASARTLPHHESVAQEGVGG